MEGQSEAEGEEVGWPMVAVGVEEGVRESWEDALGETERLGDWDAERVVDTVGVAWAEVLLADVAEELSVAVDCAAMEGEREVEAVKVPPPPLVEADAAPLRVKDREGVSEGVEVVLGSSVALPEGVPVPLPEVELRGLLEGVEVTLTVVLALAVEEREVVELGVLVLFPLTPPDAVATEVLLGVNVALAVLVAMAVDVPVPVLQGDAVPPPKLEALGEELAVAAAVAVAPPPSMGGEGVALLEGRAEGVPGAARPPLAVALEVAEGRVEAELLAAAVEV